MTYKTLKIIEELLTDAVNNQKAICERADAKFAKTERCKDYGMWTEALEAKSNAEHKMDELSEALCDFNSHKWS